MSTELELPEGVRAPMRRGAARLCRNVAAYLRDGNPEVLATARDELARIVGLFRLLRARRAALFCAEVENWLASLHRSCDGARWQSPQIDMQNLLIGAVLQLQDFIVGMSLPVLDEEFDASVINAMRTARGKKALPLDRSRSAVLRQFPLPDFLQRVEEKIALLQAELQNSNEPSDRQVPHECQRHLADLASLLEVCGLTMETRHLPKALVHLELHFRYLSKHCRPCTAQEIASTARLAAVDYLLIDGRKSLVLIVAGRLDSLLNSMTAIVNIDSDADDREAAQLRGAAKQFLHIDEALGLLTRSGIMNSYCRLQHELMVHGVELCRHIGCAASWRFSAASGVHEGALLLVRVSLLLQKMLLQSGNLDHHARNLAKKICRDCARFIAVRQRELRHSLLAMHGEADGEFLVLVNSELECCRSAISACLGNISGAQGIHYVSETLCTEVSKLSQTFLVMGQVALHEVLEELRECLTRGLERQHSIGHALQEVLCELCELLQRPYSATSEKNWWGESARQRLAGSISRCVAETKWFPDADDSAVSVALHRSDDPQSRAPVAIEHLPVHLASNIRDLLSCTEELAACAENPERFEELNRRLIVELRMLATGARALHVDRVARLSGVLAEVHQAIAGLGAGQQLQTGSEVALPLSLLVSAHRQLRSGLNQAAARQEVSSSREIIAALYQWLEDMAPNVASRATPEGFTVFHREAEELMSRIEECAGKSSGDSGARILLHLLHTLKGNARVFGADTVATLCHRCEQALLHSHAHNHVTSAIAESGGSAIYLSSEETLAVLVRQLRAAIDELVPIASWQDAAGADAKPDCRLPKVPLALSQEDSVVISAMSLRRMAELTAAARTGSRAMSDVLQTSRQSADDARLALLGDLLVEQERCTEQLGEEIAGSTRISFARLTPRLQRLVGRLANLLDKQLCFQVHNDALRADRELVESLVAPLEHLLRNAIDHGIEPVMQRRAQGKPDSGTITLALEEKDDALVIALTDDGAGIDAETLPAHALRLGICVDEQAHMKERLQWLFLPGFSCREHVTEHAGHGIGLAMVGTSITKLGGHVEVASVPGQGCSFRIVLPL